MTAFDVYINGRKVCTAGLSQAGVVTHFVTWVRGVCGKGTKEKEDLFYALGGLVSRTETHVDWTHRELKVGDEVRIVVTEKEKVSKPKKRRKESKTMIRKGKMEYLKRLAGELGFELSKKKEPGR